MMAFAAGDILDHYQVLLDDRERVLRELLELGVLRIRGLLREEASSPWWVFTIAWI
jgi:hypothetical protein